MCICEAHLLFPCSGGKAFGPGLVCGVVVVEEEPEEEEEGRWLLERPSLTLPVLKWSGRSDSPELEDTEEVGLVLSSRST